MRREHWRLALTARHRGFISSTTRLALVALVALMSLALASAAHAAPTWIAAPITLATGGEVSDPDVAASPSGEAVVVWSGPGQTVHASVHEVGPRAFTWRPQGVISPPGRVALAPRVAIDRDGNALAVWLVADAGRHRAQATFRPVGGEWQPQGDLSAPGEHPTDVTVAFDADGDAFVGWVDATSVGRVGRVVRRSAAGIWQGSEDERSPDDLDDLDQQVALDGSGKTTLLWRALVPGGSVIRAAERLPGGSLSAPIELSRRGQEALEPRLAVGPSGEAVATWRRFNGGEHVVQAALRPAAEAWGAPTTLSVPGAGADQPRVALDSSGNALAVWRRGLGAQATIEARAYDGAGPLLGAIWGPSEVAAGRRSSFAVRASLDAWSAVPFSPAWSFSDGPVAFGAAITRTFERPGSYVVSVRQADALGNTTVAEKVVTVRPVAVLRLAPAGERGDAHRGRALGLKVRVARRLRSGSSLAVTATCRLACRTTVTGRLRIGAGRGTRAIILRSVRGRGARLLLRVARRDRGVLAAALRRGRRVSASVEVTARAASDRSGSETQLRRSHVVLLRPCIC